MQEMPLQDAHDADTHCEHSVLACSICSQITQTSHDRQHNRRCKCLKQTQGTLIFMHAQVFVLPCHVVRTGLFRERYVCKLRVQDGHTQTVSSERNEPVRLRNFWNPFGCSTSCCAGGAGTPAGHTAPGPATPGPATGLATRPSAGGGAASRAKALKICRRTGVSAWGDVFRTVRQPGWCSCKATGDFRFQLQPYCGRPYQ